MRRCAALARYRVHGTHQPRADPPWVRTGADGRQQVRSGLSGLEGRRIRDEEEAVAGDLDRRRSGHEHCVARSELMPTA
jgi:hypothetical protein